MLELRLLNDNDISLIEVWLNKEHVKRWYEIPHFGITINDWVYEMKTRNGEFGWLIYLVVLWQAILLDCDFTINVWIAMKI